MNRTNVVVVAVTLATLAAVSAFGMMQVTGEETAQQLPAGTSLTITPTPDLASAVDSPALLADVFNDAGLSTLTSAIESGDVDRILQHVAWEMKPCYVPGSLPGKGSGTERCEAGPATLPMVNAGNPVEFWISADTLRPYLEMVFAEPLPSLALAARSVDAPSQYVLAYTGAVKGQGFLPVVSTDVRMTGVFLHVEDGKITTVEFLGDTYGAYRSYLDHGIEDKYEILALNE